MPVRGGMGLLQHMKTCWLYSETWGKLEGQAGSKGAPVINEGLAFIIAKNIVDGKEGTSEITYLADGLEVPEEEFSFNPEEGDVYVDGSAYAGQTTMAAVGAAAV